MEKIFVKPAVAGQKVRVVKDRIVRKEHLKEGGEWVKKSTYWSRCLKRGDVVFAEEGGD